MKLNRRKTGGNAALWRGVTLVLDTHYSHRRRLFPTERRHRIPPGVVVTVTIDRLNPEDTIYISNKKKEFKKKKY